MYVNNHVLSAFNISVARVLFPRQTSFKIMACLFRHKKDSRNVIRNTFSLHSLLYGYIRFILSVRRFNVTTLRRQSRRRSHLNRSARAQ